GGAGEQPGRHSGERDSIRVDMSADQEVGGRLGNSPASGGDRSPVVANAHPPPSPAAICPSPAPREREGPTPQVWEGEGRWRDPHPARFARHPLPRCGRGGFLSYATSCCSAAGSALASPAASTLSRAAASWRKRF